MRDAVPPPVVHEALQVAMLVGEAETVDCAAETPAAVTVTVALSMMLTLFATAVIVLVSAAVEFSVQVATPLPLAVCVRLVGTSVLLLPETESVTLALGTALPN